MAHQSGGLVYTNPIVCDWKCVLGCMCQHIAHNKQKQLHTNKEYKHYTTKQQQTTNKTKQTANTYNT